MAICLPFRMAEIGDLPVKTMALPYFDEIDYKGF
jgi:hypothetical protein